MATIDHNDAEATQLAGEIVSLFALLDEKQARHLDLADEAFEVVQNQHRHPYPDYRDLVAAIKERLADYHLSVASPASRAAVLIEVQKRVEILTDYLHVLSELINRLPANWRENYKKWQQIFMPTYNTPRFNPLRAYLFPVMNALHIECPPPSSASSSKKRRLLPEDLADAERASKRQRVAAEEDREPVSK